MRQTEPRRFPQHLDVIDENEEYENTGEHADRGHHEASGKVSSQCVGDHAHAVAGRPNRRRRRAFDLLMASINSAGGSTTTPPRMIHRLAQIDVVSIRYWTIGATEDFTAITEQAKPAMRNPNTVRIE